MEALLTGWITFFIISYLLEYKSGINQKEAFTFLAFVFSLLELFLKEPNITFFPFIISFLAIYTFNVDKKKMLLFLFNSVIIAGLVFSFQDYKNFIIMFSFLPLFTITLSTYKESSLFYIFIILQILASFYNIYLSIALFLTFIITYKVFIYINKIEEEKEKFKITVAKTIDSEIKREFEKLELKLQTAYKKLKELFKLSSYTVKELSLSDVAEKIVEGLVNLGYTGSFIVFRKDDIQKKEGFFPNYRIYLNANITAATLYESNKVVLIPLVSEGENLGMIGVYSKISLSPEEVEFLLTYANTISTSIAKTNFLLEKIKLRDLVQKTIESIKMGILVLDNNFKIELINKSAKDLIGKDIKAGNLFDEFTILKKIKDDLNNVLKLKSNFETKLIVSEYPKIIWEVKVFPLFSYENIENIVIIIEDITDKEEMENQILQSEKLAVIGRLVASLSHEVKNPLAIINQSAFSLKRKINKICKENSEEFIDSIERIERNIGRANDIIERLLNFTKPYYSKSEKVNVKEAMEEAIKLAFFQAKRSNISLSKRLNDAYIKGNKNALVQLFINILINAIESIEAKGSIHIRIYKRKKEGKVIIKIKDTGKGIPKEYINKIFEPFFTTKEKGTGLGLAVSYRIVESHNGKIYVDSEEGKGTEFTIEFPIYQEGSDG